MPIEVTGGFICSENQIASLKGSPQKVGWFDCSGNGLTSLEGAPQKIKGDFYCSYNQLTFLEGAPEVVVGNFYYLGNPNLNSLEGIGEVKGEILKYQVY